jgi:uncharacterized repeat protein (TIGR02543 family)
MMIQMMSEFKRNKKMKNIKAVVLPLLVLSLVSCGETKVESSASSTTPTTSSSEVATYTVTYQTNGGSAIASSTIKEGGSLQEPTSPTKTSYIFTGWYLDEALTKKASFPLSITANTTLYAGYQECRDYYLAARDATVGSDSKGFSYNSNLSINISYSALSYSGSGSYTGVSSYNPSAEASYYEKIAYTGLLFSNHTTHEYLKNNSLVTIKVDDEDKVTSYKAESKEAGYKYDSSSFAKALFSYSKDDIKSVDLSTDGKYEIKSKQGFSSIAKTVLSNVNNKYVEMIVGELPETESSYHNYVTFSSDETIKDYSYSFTITVKGITLAFSYGLEFTSANKASPITLPTFSGLATSSEEISTKLTSLSSAISSYKSSATSSYDFSVKTGIDFASTNEINATIKGKALRAVNNGVTYFNNTTEVDSDFKNSDLYKDNGAEDYKRTRGKIASGAVYDVYDPAIGFKKYTEVTTSTALDEFYYLIPSSLLIASNFSCVFSSIKDGITTLTLPLITSSAISSIFTLVNESTRLDPSLAKHVNVLGEYDASSITSNEATIEMDLSGTTLKEVRINLEGKVKTSFASSVSFTTEAEASYDLSISLTTTTDAASYTIPSAKEDIIQ